MPEAPQRDATTGAWSSRGLTTDPDIGFTRQPVHQLETTRRC